MTEPSEGIEPRPDRRPTPEGTSTHVRIDAANLESTRPLVLAIDDSPDVVRLLQVRLKSEAVDFASASSGLEGMEMARRLRPAVILLDIEMPGTDGFEILRMLKESPDTVQTPVIMLSGLSSAHDKVTAFDLGAADYVTKPFDIAELRVRVRAAIRTFTLFQMLAQRAQIDGLTGLWNRSHFDRRLNEEVSRGARHGGALSLAILDVDRFKHVNDSFGHPAGDAVLSGVGSLLRREIRESDVPCRYGGEEFALIMPDTPPEDAAAVCDRIRQTLQQVTWPRHPEHTVTISIGIIGATGPFQNGPDFWVERADRNLYTAKSTGRNRVIWSTLDAPPLALTRAS